MPPPTERLDWISFGRFLTNYDITRVERKKTELLVINSSVQKREQNREKNPRGDYYTRINGLKAPCDYEHH